MKLKVLPAIIGVVLTGGVTIASADVSLFGHIDASYNGLDQDGGYDDTVFRCTTCSIGFKGSEDLGNGLKAIFSIDFEYDIFNRHRVSSTTYTYTTTSGTFTTTLPTGTGAITDRDQWVGLAGSFGKIRVGTISTGYKSHGAMIDPLYRTALQGRDHGLQSLLHSGAGEELQGRATNTLRWDSADYSGVKLLAHYTLDSNEADGEDNNPYGVGGSYEHDGLLVFGDYMNNDQNGPGMTAGWKVGGKYDMGLFSFMGQYEDYDDSATFNDDVSTWHVAGMVNKLLGMDIYLAYGKGSNDDVNEEYTSWTLAVMHNFSKNTMVYLGHSQFDCDVGGSSAAFTICRTVGAGGGENDQTALGLKHTF